MWGTVANAFFSMVTSSVLLAGFASVEPIE